MNGELCSKLSEVKEECDSAGVRLIAVSKTQPNSILEEAYQCGQRDFGENKVQDLEPKSKVLPKDINWHFIGHLQRNKVKYIAPFVSLIHSLDSIRLANEISKQAVRNERTIDCLLQVHISGEDSKFGLSPNEVHAFLNDFHSNDLLGVRLIGLMGMATFTDNESQIRAEFASLYSLYEKSRQNFPTLDILSMGMTGDYKIAIEEGSNMVRVGTKIFGARKY